MAYKKKPSAKSMSRSVKAELSPDQAILLKRKARLYRILVLNAFKFIIFLAIIGFFFLQRQIIKDLILEAGASYKYFYLQAIESVEKKLDFLNPNIEGVEVHGLKNLTREEVLAKIYNQDNIKKTKFHYSIGNIYHNLKSLPLVEAVTIKRDFNKGKIFIFIKERNIIGIAILENESPMLIDENGISLPGEKLINRFTDKIRILGVENYPDYLPLYRYLKTQKIYDKVAEVSFISKRRWNLKFKNNLLVKLPAKDWQSGLDLLIQLNSKLGILLPDNKIIYLDLRIPGKIFLR